MQPRATVANVDLHYPSIPGAASNERVVIVAPHMDDEAIGAGGYALDAIRSGAEVSLVFLTAGDCARFAAQILHRTAAPLPAHFLSLGRTRIAEAKLVAQRLGVRRDRLFILGYPDQGLATMLRQPKLSVRSSSTDRERVAYAEAVSPGAPHTFENALADLRAVLRIARPDTIIAPVSFDIHPDHHAAAELTDLAIESLDWTPRRLGYLIHTSRYKSIVSHYDHALLPPPHMRSFTWATYPLAPEVQKQKDAVLQIYKSQRPYVYLLRNSFIRPNELFFVYRSETMTAGEPAASFACAPLSRLSSSP